MAEDDKRLRFERSIMPHMDAAYNLARWLVREDRDAEEATQEAFLRAYKFFDSFHGEDGKSWLLAIVRNTCYTLHGRKAGWNAHEEFDEEVHQAESLAPGAGAQICRNPEELAIAQADRELVSRAIEALPVVFREVLVMREIEELSYREIAKIADIPLGTVMSRLARGRQLLHEALLAQMRKESRK